jgi:hypothetical protein
MSILTANILDDAQSVIAYYEGMIDRHTCVSGFRQSNQPTGNPRHVSDPSRRNAHRRSARPGLWRVPLQRAPRNRYKRVARMSTRIVWYHSREWDALVEQGWVTVTVENGWARMARINRKTH